MLTSFPARGWKIVRVDADHLSSPDETRRARVVLQREGDSWFLVPTYGDRYRVSGYRVTEELLASDPVDAWTDIAARDWCPGLWPVVIGPGELDFVSPADLMRQRRADASRAVLRSFDAAIDVFERVSELEYADDVLGGHPIPRLALLRLWHDVSVEDRVLVAEDRQALERRVRDAMPAGPAGADSAARGSGFEPLLLETSKVEQLRLAALDAFALDRAFPRGAWARIREQVAREWWRRSQGQSRSNPVGGVELAGLDAAFAQPCDDYTLRYLGYAHLPRLEMFAQQYAALQRMYPSGVLSTWSRMRSQLAAVSSSVLARPQQVPWRAAESAASVARQALGLHSSEPIDLKDALRRLGGIIAGATLPSKSARSAWLQGAGSAPLFIVTPAALAASTGALRFSLARSLGELIESLAAGMPDPWGISDDDEADGARPGAFANAFAVYFLAPRSAMHQVLDPPAEDVEDAWILGSAELVARTFGLSSGAALAHVVNGLDGVERARRLDALHRDPRWEAFRRETSRLTNADWKGDGNALRDEAGHPVATVQGALERPQSAAFEELLGAAEEENQLDEEVIGDLRLAAA